MQTPPEHTGWSGLPQGTHRLDCNTKPRLQSTPQAPPLHTAMPDSGAAHAAHPGPQCCGSLTVSTHRPPHAVSPAAHSGALRHAGCSAPPQGSHWPSRRVEPALQATAHCPLTQLTVPPAGAAQGVSQAPQWLTSLLSCRHEPPQFVSPVPQFAVHCPPEHTAVEGHTTPQRPQWLASFADTHRPAQLVCPVGHAQAPETHRAPPVHRRSQTPQCSLLSVKRAQRAPHTVCPERHVQLALAQPCPGPHARPHAPQ